MPGLTRKPYLLAMLTAGGLVSPAHGLVSSIATAGFTLGSASQPGGNTYSYLSSPTANGVGGYAISALNSHLGQNQTYVVYGNASGGSPAALVTQGNVSSGTNTFTDYTYAGIGTFSMANDGTVLYVMTSTRLNNAAPSLDALMLKSPSGSTSVLAYDGSVIGGTSAFASKYYGIYQSSSSITDLASARITQAGDAYFFVDGVSNSFAGTQSGTAIFRIASGSTTPTLVLKNGDSISGTSGLTVSASSSSAIDTSNFGISASGTNYIDQVTASNGTTLMVSGATTGASASKLFAVGDAAVGAFTGETWTGFSRAAINDSGTTAVAGSISSASNSGYAIAINGVVQLESGSTIPKASGGTVTLSTSTGVNPDMKLNSAGDYATIYSDYPAPGPGTNAKGKLIFDGVDIADTGTLIDTSGGTYNGAALTSINPGSGLTLGERQSNGTVDLYFFGSVNGNTTNILLHDSVNVASGPSNLTLASSSNNGIGNISSGTNFSASTSAVVFATTSNVALYDFLGNTGPFTINIPTTVSPASTTVSGSTSYIFTGAGGIAGSAALNKSGTASLTLNDNNTYTGGTNVAAGTLVLGSANAFPTATSLAISSGATLSISNHGSGTANTPIISSLTNNGTIDITNNAMVIQGANNSIGTINSQIQSAYNGGLWNGSGGGIITSSLAASDSTHLTAVGIATGFTSFENLTVSAADVLIKYTYYGDTNLDGTVDGSDYSRIDNAVLTGATGWYNGDFNYDGIINGSDYTLIDNSFNTQGSNLAAELAAPTTQISGAGLGTSVPEPVSAALCAIIATGLSRRRTIKTDRVNKASQARL